MRFGVLAAAAAMVLATPASAVTVFTGQGSADDGGFASFTVREPGKYKLSVATSAPTLISIYERYVYHVDWFDAKTGVHRGGDDIEYFSQRLATQPAMSALYLYAVDRPYRGPSGRMPGAREVGSYSARVWTSIEGDGPFAYQATFAAIPEPASWAMLIGGFGLVGAAARRRSWSVSGRRNREPRYAAEPILAANS